MCPPANELSVTYYSAKKLLVALQLPHKKIDSCPNGCSLYWNDKVDLDRCEYYGDDRYEKKTLRDKDIVKKVIIYFRIGIKFPKWFEKKLSIVT